MPYNQPGVITIRKETKDKLIETIQKRFEDPPFNTWDELILWLTILIERKY